MTRFAKAIDGPWTEPEDQRGIAVFLMVLLGTVLLSAASSNESPAMVLALATCVGLLVPRHGTRAWLPYATVLVAFALQSFRVLQSFPATANHTFLQWILLGIAALHLRGGPAERRHMLRCFRWLTVFVIFVAGIQKLVHGQYFDGRMLAVMLAKHPNYQMVLGPLVSETEIARLTSLSIHRAGDGPFVVASVPLTTVSNIAWVGEVVVAVLLMASVAWAPWAAAALIIAIEAAAREIVFGALMLSLLLLFVPFRIARRGYYVLAVALLLLVPVGLDLVPGRTTLFGFDVW